MKLHTEGSMQPGVGWKRTSLCFACVPFGSSSCSMISIVLNLGIRKAFHLHYLEFAPCHTTPKISLCCSNRRCKQMHQFAQKSTQKGPRNSAEDSVCMLSIGGDAPQSHTNSSNTPGTSEASAQAELPRKDAGLQDEPGASQ